MEYVHPHMLPNGDQQAMDFKRVTRDAAGVEGTDSEYVEGDLVVAGAGGLVKYTDTNLGKVGLAGRNYVQPFALDYWLERGEPVNLIPDDNEFVASYQNDALDGADYTFLAADLLAVEQGAVRDLVFNATEKCATIRDSSGTASTVQVKLLRLFRGGVGDDNVQVVVRIERDSLMS